MTLYYEGSDGSVIDLMSSSIYAQDPEKLTGSAWEYSTISGVNGVGRVKTFYKDTQEASLTLAIMADSAEEFNQVMYNIHRIFDRDIRRMTPGKLWWNGFCKEVFAVETSQDEFEELFEAVEREVTFISVYPYWTKKSTYFYKADMSESTGTLDFDFDFDFDLDNENVAEVVENDCIDAANFEIRFYGPCSNPTVTIAGHAYCVLATLLTGEYINVNSLTKTITKINAYGASENVFHLRDRDSYIFEKIPEGTCVVTRNKELPLSITIYDERGEPDWI